MIHTEALKLALEALESTQLFAAHEHYPRRRVADALDALRAALEQPEQEPVAWRYEIATRKAKGGEYHGWESRLSDEEPCAPVGAIRNAEPLYTHPPRREWRGLSKDESLKLWGMRSDGPSNLEIIGFSRAIEAALKERNA